MAALEVSVQAQIIDLFEVMNARYGLTLVLYPGKNCEFGASEDLFDNPAQPYTRLLVSSIRRWSR